MVRALQQLGLSVKVLSGDADTAVAVVARSLAVTDYRGGCSPQDKLLAIQALQQQGHRVAMVGDGMNDGPVLAVADLSIALGEAVLAQYGAAPEARARLAEVDRRLEELAAARGGGGACEGPQVAAIARERIAGWRRLGMRLLRQTLRETRLEKEFLSCA